MAISGPLRVAKVKDLHMEMNINSNFKFSDGWLRNFKRRHGIRQLSIVGERKSADIQAAENFRASFGAIAHEP